MAFLLKTRSISKLCSCFCNTNKGERQQVVRAHDAGQTTSQAPRSWDSDSTGSTETDPYSDFKYILDPDIFSQGLQKSTLQQHNDSPCPAFTLAISNNIRPKPIGAPIHSQNEPNRNPTPATSGLPVPIYRQNQLPQPMVNGHHPFPPTPRLSVKQLHTSRYHPGQADFETEVEDHFEELAPSLQALSETQLINAQKCMRFYQQTYNLSYTALPPRQICSTDKLYFANHLACSSETLVTSGDYSCRNQARAQENAMRRKDSNHRHRNIAKTLLTADPDAVKDADKDDIRWQWGEDVLEHKRWRVARKAQQKAIKATCGGDFVPGDYARCSARSRRLWLLRSEIKLQEKQSKRRDLHGKDDQQQYEQKLSKAQNS